MGSLFGGGDNGAKKAAEKSRELQRIANDRQLAELRADKNRTGDAPRIRPQGRRLFADDDGKSTLA